MSNQRKRYAIVGTGGRAGMYVDAIYKTYQDSAMMVGLCDVSQTRMDWYNNQLAEHLDAAPLPTFHSDNFDRMIAETKPDTVIVTSMDSTHHLYIKRAMELGCDVITEKPMTIDAAKARSIFATIERTGRRLRVTFNYRYAPIATTVREQIMQGKIGRPLHVNFQWMLDTFHGADYFRRWHREKDKSGGLLVHKATHHFDLINWWIDSYPQQVFALGDLMFYGRENAQKRGETYTYDRYTGQAAAANDPFGLSLTKNETLRGLYLEAEAESGYLRDRNVFGDNISAEDTMSITARYRNGAILTYSLLAYSPWEGYRVAITGDKGRLEVDMTEQVGRTFMADQDETPIFAPSDPDVIAQFGGEGIRIFPMFGRPYTVEIPAASGGHGGADPVMLEQLFSPTPPADSYNRTASHIDGAASILMGIAANESMKTGGSVNVDDLLKLPEKENGLRSA
ncbi:MAG: Gfo/Idh/MocA family oxidoreductase [Chloroflexota bacterium]|nr:Gfo/Idh/MocA family oxidoreductase [Chloroflexota bacterium]